MRLAYIVGTYPQPSETFISREVEAMRARGHDVELFSLFAPDGIPSAGIHYGWPTELDRAIRHYFPRRSHGSLVRRWQRQLRHLGCEAVMAHFGSLPSTIALEAAGDLPLFISVHARDIYVEADRLADKCARARAVVTCTRANVHHLRAQFPRYADKIHLIYHGLPDSWLTAPVPERPRKSGEPLRLLAVGRLVEKKGFRYLLEAVARLHAEGFPLHMTLVGDGPLGEALIEQREALGLQDVLALEGWMHETQLRAGYAWADVFCCPSVIAADNDRDGLPNVIPEAMSCGLPVIGSKISGIPEAVEDGVTGLLVPPADPGALAIAITCCADPAVRARMGRRAAAVSRERFAATPWLDQLDALYRMA